MGLFNRDFHSEELGGVAAGLLLGVAELSLQIVALGLPFADCLVERALLLLEVVGVSGGLVLKDRTIRVGSRNV